MIVTVCWSVSLEGHVGFLPPCLQALLQTLPACPPSLRSRHHRLAEHQCFPDFCGLPAHPGDGIGTGAQLAHAGALKNNRLSVAAPASMPDSGYMCMWTDLCMCCSGWHHCHC